MTLEEFQQCIEFNIKHNLKHSILGLGAPGVGKSQVIRQIGEKLGYKVIDMRLAQMSEVEIGGLIYPNEERTKTKWLAPEILPDEARDGEKTILLLDEITSCPKRVQVAAYQLILDRRVGQYKLPEGTVVIGLGNREDDDGVYIQLAGPLADRFEILYIDVDFESWKNDFAIPHGIYQGIIDYLSFKPSALHNQEEVEDEIVFATPRSWERVSDILLIDDNIDNPIIQHKIIGNIGELEGKQFIAYLKNANSHVSVSDFINGKAMTPSTVEDMNILLNGLASRVSFIKHMESVNELSAEQRTELEAVIKSIFTIKQTEYVVLGLRKLLDLNRLIVKNIFAELDDPMITVFVMNNKAILGM